ncbi:MAG TPA: DUF2309 domain-containing protein [Candidatus Acidoferrum sp.]|nr:DUF2309 domain-containing protein [Candidatus Acidoferrum sp.]
MNAILEPEIRELDRPLTEIVNAACKRIPPLWSLKNFVAVNPFVGLTDRHFLEAARLMQQVGHGEMLMPAGFYRDQIASGRITDNDFQVALAVSEKTLPAGLADKVNFPSLAALQKSLAKAAAEKVRPRVLTFADFVDARNQTGWAACVVEEISKWCSAYFDQGQSSWRMPWRQLGLFAAWKAAARLDANPELMGLEKFRAFADALPDDHWEWIDRALGQLGVPDDLLPDFFHRQLMSLPGWSGYVQYLVREKSLAGQADDSLAQLLAIRLAYDLALLRQFGSDPAVFGEWQKQLAGAENSGEEFSSGLLARFVAQEALECAYQNQLIAKLKNHAPKPAAAGQKSLQAIFCIDVRSEVFRRALEAQSDQIETIGFAGFCGMPIEYLKFGQASGGAQCPVLLTPKFKVREALRQADGEAPLLRRMNFRQTVNGAWNAFKTSAISCFSFVETAGLWFGVKLARDSLALAPAEPAYAGGGRRRFCPKIERELYCPEQPGHYGETGIALADQISLAAGALKNMGLVSNFAQVVLICGHGSATANNPYGAALDCGACGGHTGDANARVAAAILNQPVVREGLAQQRIEIPNETIFIAGLHNTTTDEILIYEDQALSAGQALELKKIKGWLSAASKRARRERATSLGLAEGTDAELDEKIFARSRDWSQVRPEWGLAGNAAFIAAPRERTKGLNLGGRIFLHNYHADLDADKSTLELILTGPMIVASWINLQYYGSTVDNRRFGSGNKVLHNVVGTFGVWQGNGGDLQPGLPLQSLHDGTRLRHEPLRLSVFVEASRADISAILAKQPGVLELIQNGWVHLFAIEEAGKKFYRHTGNGFKKD